MTEVEVKTKEQLLEQMHEILKESPLLDKALSSTMAQEILDACASTYLDMELNHHICNRADRLARLLYRIKRFAEICEKDLICYGNTINVKDGDKWEVVPEVNLKEFIAKYEALCLDPEITNLRINEQEKVLEQFVRSISASIRSNCVIQFDDFYLDEAKLFKGFYTKSYPTFRIRGLTLAEVNAKPSIPKEIDELCHNLAGKDKGSYETFLDMLAYTFMAEQSIKRRNSLALWIDDPIGGKGKSLLATLMQEVVGEENTVIVSGELTDYDRFSIATALFVIFPEMTGWLNTRDSSFIKSLVSADTMHVRTLYKDPVSVRPRANCILCSNNPLKTQEKNGGIARRWTFTQPVDRLNEDGLNKPQEWFDALFTDEAIRQFRAFLVARALDLIQNHGGRIRVSEQCIQLRKQWMGINNSSEDFLNSVYSHDDFAEIEYKQVQELYIEYKDYCVGNGLTVLSTTKFYANVESKTGFARKQCNINSVLKSRGLYYIRTRESEPEILDEGRQRICVADESTRELWGAYRVCVDENQPNRSAYFWVRK